MTGPWRDPKTGVTVDFCSSYQGESSYRFTDWRTTPPDVHRFRCPINPSVERGVPELKPFYAGEGDIITEEQAGIWLRYCAASQADFVAWLESKL